MLMGNILENLVAQSLYRERSFVKIHGSGLLNYVAFDAVLSLRSFVRSTGL